MLALLGNFNHAIEANETAMDSAGSATKENEAYMGGLEAKTNQVKASFQELSQSVVNSDFVKGGLDIAISLMAALNTKAGATATSITLLGTALAGVAGMAVQGHWISTLSTGFGKMASGVKKLSSALGILPGKLGLIAVAITAVVALWDHFHVTAEEALEKVQELEDQKETEYGTGSRYDELINKQSQLNALEEAELAHLEAKKKLLEDNIRLANLDAYTKWQEESGYLATGKGQFETPEGEFVAATKDIADLNNLLMGITTLQDDIMTGWTGIEELPGEFRDIVNSTTETATELQKWKDMGFELSDAQERYLALSGKLTDIYANNEDAVLAFGLAYEAAMRTAGYSSEESLEAAGQVIDDFVGKMEEGGKLSLDAETETAEDKITQLGTDAKAVEGTYKMHFEISQDGDVPSVPGGTVKVSGGNNALGTTNAKGGPTLVNELGPELISANGEAWIAGGGNPVVTNLPKGAIVLTADQTKSALKDQGYTGKMKAHAGGLLNNPMSSQKPRKPTWQSGMGRQELAKIHGQQGGLGLTEEEIRHRMGEYTWQQLHPQGDKTGSTPGPGSGGGSGGSGSESYGPPPVDIKAQTQAFKDQLDLLKDRLEIMEKEGKSEEERIDQIKKIQAEIERQKQWYYDHGEDENSKYIRDLEKQWLDYADEIKSLYKEQAGIYDKLFGAVADKAGDEIEALEKQKEAIQKQNDETQKQIELEKALDDLARARQQKKLVFKDGRMQYVTDVDAVSKAQQRIDEIKNRETMDKQIADIDKKIAEWQAYQDQWSAIGGDYEKAQDLAIIAKKLGIDLNKENWTEQLKDVQTYIDKYNDLMVKGGAENVALKARAVPITGGNAGGAVAPANLWNMGVPTPASMMSNAVSGLSNLAKSTSITIQNFNPNLPGVSDGEGFVKYLRNNFLQQTLQFANG